MPSILKILIVRIYVFKIHLHISEFPTKISIFPIKIAKFPWSSTTFLEVKDPLLLLGVTGCCIRGCHLGTRGLQLLKSCPAYRYRDFESEIISHNRMSFIRNYVTDIKMAAVVWGHS